MDNHRAAAWCWMQHIDPTKQHSLFHIDRHYDTLQSQMPAWLRHVPERWDKMSIEDYLGLSYAPESAPAAQLPLFSFDNYLSIYFHMYGASITARNFATHEHGD